MTNPTPHGQAPQQEAQEPCPTCAALARTVMLDQVSFDRKPDCYGIRQITNDEGVEEWEDIRTSPDVAREEANDMMATGRGEIYEVVPLWTTPQPAPAPLSRDQIREVFMAHGFTIKEGQTDLKQYVYDAAYALLGTKPAPLSEQDPLQGAANWLAQAHGQFCVSVLQGCLMIGYNRAKRLHDAALAAQGGQ